MSFSRRERSASRTTLTRLQGCLLMFECAVPATHYAFVQVLALGPLEPLHKGVKLTTSVQG